MPGHKLKPQKLQCPFCSTISTRGTGLSAHVRAQHPREYVKWNKNPNRLLEAAAAASPQQSGGTIPAKVSWISFRSPYKTHTRLPSSYRGGAIFDMNLPILKGA